MWGESKGTAKIGWEELVLESSFYKIFEPLIHLINQSLLSPEMWILTATNFVGRVPTIRSSVTMEWLRHTLAISTLEFIISAWWSCRLWIAALLIWTISTIIFSITAPKTIHTFWIHATELIWITALSMAAGMFIRFIGTMSNSITNLTLGDTFAIHTGSFVEAACCCRAWCDI